MGEKDETVPDPLIRVGTCGWSYPAGAGTWNGLFYPPRGASGFRAADELPYYADHFDTVEVDSTFYRPPDAALTRRWVDVTPPDFIFSVKLHQVFTHGPMQGRGGPARHLPGVSPIPSPSPADLEAFRAGLGPIAESGKLGMVLVQFPPSFHRTPESLEYLASLLASLRPYPLAVELRHRSWSDRHDETVALLASHGATWVQIDEPKFTFSIRQSPDRPGPGPLYMRLHGRNAAKWWTHDSPEERYDYLYSGKELDAVADAVARIKARTGKTRAYVYLNNHFAAKAVVNATQLKQLLGEPAHGEYRAELVERYPELNGLVVPARDLL